MNREELIRIVTWQLAIVTVAAVLSSLVAGLNGFLSALCGGLCVAVPNSLLALTLLLGQTASQRSSAYVMLVGEFVKIFATCALFVLVAKLYPGLNWPAMIFGIIAAVGSYFALLFVKH